MPVHASIEPLHWESRFFARTSARLCFNHNAPPLNQARLADYARVQAKLPTDRHDLLDALQALGFQLVESECDFLLSVPVVTHDDPTVTIATAADIPVLQRLAAHSFQHSRFRPPWYAQQDSERFYACWVANAVAGTFDDQCLLLRSEKIRTEKIHSEKIRSEEISSEKNHGNADHCQGFVTLRKLDDRQARIGLLAGRGQGARLMAAAQHWCAQRAIRHLYVATQFANIAAMRRYILSGALIHSTAYWLYK